MHAQTAQEIVQRSLERDSFHFEPPPDYVYTLESVTRMFDKSGRVTSTGSESYEVMVLYGETYRRRISKDGKPLAVDKQRKEQAKFDKGIEKRQRETPEQTAKREAARRRAAAEELACRQEFARVFSFRLAGGEPVNGRAAWLIEAEPIHSAAPKCNDNKMAGKFHIRLWIDQAELRWSKVEAVSFEVWSAGLLVARAAKGARMEYEARRVDADTWLPAREQVRADIKVGLVKTLHMEETATYSRYRKFGVDSRIVAVGQ